jgi:uncharacterized membrane protein
MKKYYWLLAVLLLALAPVVYMLVIYNQLPEEVALHFNLKGEADRMGPKSEGLTAVLLLSGLSIVMWFLLTNLHRFDPKQRGRTPSPIFRKFAAIIVFAMSIISFIIISAFRNRQMDIMDYLPSALSLLFAVIGNYMPQLKPNYFAGFRTPWALNDEANWKYTHQVAGKYWFWGGVASAIGCLLAPGHIVQFVFIAAIAVMSIIPFIKSYLFFKNQRKSTTA